MSENESKTACILSAARRAIENAGGIDALAADILSLADDAAGMDTDSTRNPTMQPRPLPRTQPKPTPQQSAAAIARDLGVTPEQLARLVADARGRREPTPPLVRLGPGGDFTRDIIGG